MRTAACARLGKFALVGLLGAVLQLAAIPLLMNCLHASPLVATPIAVEVAILHNFAWHERFTWRDRCVKHTRRAAVRFWRFHAANGLISLVGNTLVLYLLADRLHLPVLASAIAAIALCAAANFIAADGWVFATDTISAPRAKSSAR